MKYSAVKANYHHWRKMYEQSGDPQRTMVRALVRAYGHGDEWKKRAELAEATLAEVQDILAKYQKRRDVPA